MITVAITLSEQCNLNCTYCGVDKLSKAKIDPNKFLADFWQKKSANPDEIFKLDFHGGEPLIQWDLIVEIIEATKHEKNVKYFMPTNGLLLTETMVEYLNQHKVQVSLSFDGLWQDLNRPQFGKKGSLSQYLSKIPIFKKLNKPECHSMIYKGNFNLLENHLYIKNTLGINPGLTLVRDIGVWDKESANKFNEAFTELVNWYIDHINTEEMPGLMKEYFGHILLFASKKIRVDNCGASETNFNFTDNKMTPCIRFKDQETIDKIPEFQFMKECHTCEVKDYCRKGCMYENIKNNGPIIELCDMYKHMYKELSRMVKNLNGNETFRKVLNEAVNDA